jgi:hypothetical protein
VARANNTPRNWSRITGGLFLFVGAWLVLILLSAGGVGLDLGPLVYPWLVSMTLSAIWLLTARALWAILPVAAFLGFGSAIFWTVLSAASSPVLWFALVVVVVPSVAASVSALRGVTHLRERRRPATDVVL